MVQTDAYQRVIDTADCSEQSDQRCGGSDRGENSQAVLQPGGVFVDDLADRARDKRPGGAFLLELQRSILCMMITRMHSIAGQRRKGFVCQMRGVRDFSSRENRVG